MMKKFALLLAWAIVKFIATALPKEELSLYNPLMFDRAKKNILESWQTCNGPMSSSSSQY